MFGSFARTAVLGAGIVMFAMPAAFADSATSTSGGGANVAIVTGDNGGTTIVVDSSKPCHVVQGGSQAKANSGAGNTTSSNTTSMNTGINTGPGGLSGWTTIGPNGPSVSINSGSGSSSMVTAGAGSGGSTTNQAKPGECIVLLHAPNK